MDELDRLFQCVVRTARDTRPEYLSRPFEVRELLELVPYRAVRADVGVETNDDFAHVVMRLLAGERGYLFVDDLMQDDLKAELKSPNPDLLSYRSYVNARVTLSQEHTRRLLESAGAGVAAPPRPHAGAAAASTAAASAAAPSSSAAPPPARAALRSPDVLPAAARREPVSAPRAARPNVTPRPLGPDDQADARVSRPGCKYCGQALPEGREVRYCPACGQNLLLRRCAACSAEVEPAWKFCVACGRAAAP